MADLKEKLDRYYSPLNFHFENMRSWAVFLNSSERYAWAAETLADKLEDMKEIMRSGLRFASPEVQALWYAWQPFAVAAVEESRERKRVYQQFDTKGLLDRTERLHDAIKAEKDDLLKRYRHEIDSGRLEMSRGDPTNNVAESTRETGTNEPQKTMSSSPSSHSDSLEKTIKDVLYVEGGIIAFCMVALGFLLSAISSFNQTNIGLAQIGLIRLCQYVPLAPTFQNFAIIVIVDVVCLSAGLFSRMAGREYHRLRGNLLALNVCLLVFSVAFFAWVVWSTQAAFYYVYC